MLKFAVNASIEKSFFILAKHVLHLVMKDVRFIPFIVIAALPWCESAIALAMGLVLGLVLQWDLPHPFSRASKILMQTAIVAMGFTLDPVAVQKTGVDSIVVTLTSLIAVIVCAAILTKLFKVKSTVGTLIASGTGICGGSAIAAMAPTIGATSSEIAVALGTVFSLNAVALFIFPPLGHYFNLSPEQFGWWAAIAIHDTSSVVGAASQYHTDSIAIAVTTKLTRALWIIPLVLCTSFLLKWRGKKTSDQKAKVPAFIFLFLLAVVIHALLPDMPIAYQWIGIAGQSMLKVAIFLIGAQLTRPIVRNVGGSALALGIALWLIMSVGVLVWVKSWS